MESSSLPGCCSVASPVAPASTRRLNQPYHLPPSHPFNPQGRLFMMPRHLSTDCIEPNRPSRKKPETS